MNQINLVLETQYIRNGRKLGRAKFDKDGYTVMPLAVLGKTTRNRTYYDIDSIIGQLREDSSLLAKLLVDGNLKGELGHPDVSALGRDAAIRRICRVDEKNVAHHIRKIYTAPLDDASTLLMGEIKPAGRYRDVLMDSLLDPFDNTSFSLRAIVAEKMRPDGVIFRTVKNLITFDAVNAGGYEQASKRFAPAVENLMDPNTVCISNLSRSDFISKSNDIAVENFSIRDVDALFGTMELSVEREVIGTYTPGESVFVDEHGEKRSLFHAFVNKA